MKKFIIAIALTAAAASSHAQMYVQGNLGQVSISDSAIEKMGSFGVGAGYQVSPNFAVDVLFQRLHNEDGLGYSYKSNALFVRAVGILPINETFSVNAKLGVGQAKTTIELSGLGTASGTGSTTYGVGFDAAINKQVSLGLDVDFYKTEGIKYTNVALNLKYKF